MTVSGTGWVIVEGESTDYFFTSFTTKKHKLNLIFNVTPNLRNPRIISNAFQTS